MALPKPILTPAKPKSQKYSFFAHFLLIYLCTDEPDYDSQPRRVKAKPTYTTYTPEHPPRRTNITNVGTRIGAAIRIDRQKAKELNGEAEQQQSEHRKHASPIAHIGRNMISRMPPSAPLLRKSGKRN